jgi:hypothetical protein
VAGFGAPWTRAEGALVSASPIAALTDAYDSDKTPPSNQEFGLQETRSHPYRHRHWHDAAEERRMTEYLFTGGLLTRRAMLPRIELQADGPARADHVFSSPNF